MNSSSATYFILHIEILKVRYICVCVMLLLCHLYIDALQPFFESDRIKVSYRETGEYYIGNVLYNSTEVCFKSAADKDVCIIFPDKTSIYLDKKTAKDIPTKMFLYEYDSEWKTDTQHLPQKENNMYKYLDADTSFFVYLLHPATLSTEQILKYFEYCSGISILKVGAVSAFSYKGNAIVLEY